MFKVRLWHLEDTHIHFLQSDENTNLKINIQQQLKKQLQLCSTPNKPNLFSLSYLTVIKKSVLKKMFNFHLLQCIVCTGDWVVHDWGYTTFYSWARTAAHCLRPGAVSSVCDDFPRESVFVWGFYHRGFAEESCGSRFLQQRCLHKIHLNFNPWS